MRSVSRDKIIRFLMGAAFSCASLPTFAQEVLPTSQANVVTPIIVPSQSSIYNQNSMQLPTPPIVHGQDIVRSADGSSCQSAIGSGGPYVDMGVIGSQDVFDRSTASIYGRIVVPLGKRGKRLDCTKLYQLEIARMQAEIEMLKTGMPVANAQIGLVSEDTRLPAHLIEHAVAAPPLQVSSHVQSKKARRAIAPPAPAPVRNIFPPR